jgi:hypothetical protein
MKTHNKLEDKRHTLQICSAILLDVDYESSAYDFNTSINEPHFIPLLTYLHCSC